ncbi:hypothetical protein R1sor_021167 [Riccia sorocarpa]|uniref:Uncharacterized protein n=1 Tax=Riccia sorocarpa TaxID=122646 RepID=A0ABD3GHX7_9MARC
MKILEPTREFLGHYEERLYAKGRTSYRTYSGARRRSLVLAGWDRSKSKILQPAEEIVRCYEDRISSLKGALQERTRTKESIPLDEDRKDAVAEEWIVVKVDDQKSYTEKEEVELQLETDVCEDKILAPDVDESPHKGIESVRVDRLDRRVSELEQENETLRAERDLRLGDLRRICTEVDQFLDVVEHFLDKPCCEKGRRALSNETAKRGSSISGVKKSLKSGIDNRKGPESERKRPPLRGSLYRDKMPVASNAPGGASSSFRRMLMMGTRKRKNPDVERREVIRVHLHSEGRKVGLPLLRMTANAKKMSFLCCQICRSR